MAAGRRDPRSRSGSCFSLNPSAFASTESIVTLFFFVLLFRRFSFLFMLFFFSRPSTCGVACRDVGRGKDVGDHVTGMYYISPGVCTPERVWATHAYERPRANPRVNADQSPLLRRSAYTQCVTQGAYSELDPRRPGEGRRSEVRSSPSRLFLRSTLCEPLFAFHSFPFFYFSLLLQLLCCSLVRD